MLTIPAGIVTTGFAFSLFFTVPSASCQEQFKVIDNAGLFSQSALGQVEQRLDDLENQTPWRIRALTTPSPIQSASQLRQLWKTDDRTIVVVEDVTSPNVLAFSAGAAVGQQLPRQFFIELQSRYGNQFFVKQEGEAQALISSLNAIDECLRRSGGCRNVPGLTDDLYNLTLATSIAGGCVFGFSARVRGRSPGLWILVFSPLWLLLFGSFGVLPVISRTDDLAPIVKNLVGFLGGAAAIYLTPILGPRPGI